MSRALGVAVRVLSLSLSVLPYVCLTFPPSQILAPAVLIPLSNAPFFSSRTSFQIYWFLEHFHLNSSDLNTFFNFKKAPSTHTLRVLSLMVLITALPGVSLCGSLFRRFSFEVASCFCFIMICSGSGLPFPDLYLEPSLRLKAQCPSPRGSNVCICQAPGGSPSRTSHVDGCQDVQGPWSLSPGSYQPGAVGSWEGPFPHQSPGGAGPTVTLLPPSGCGFPSSPPGAWLAGVSVCLDSPD